MRDGSFLFVAWAALTPMTGDGPITEPAEPLWFELSNVRTDAIAKLKTGVQREIGQVEWQEQEA